MFRVWSDNVQGSGTRMLWVYRNQNVQGLGTKMSRVQKLECLGSKSQNVQGSGTRMFRVQEPTCLGFRNQNVQGLGTRMFRVQEPKCLSSRNQTRMFKVYIKLFRLQEPTCSESMALRNMTIIWFHKPRIRMLQGEEPRFYGFISDNQVEVSYGQMSLIQKIKKRFII